MRHRTATVAAVCLASVLLIGFGLAEDGSPASAVRAGIIEPNPRTAHREVPRDPWMPRPAEPPPGVLIGRQVAQRGPYISVQVNVDEFGINIPGDAANEPSIAIDPTDPNKIVIGWRQFDSVESDFRQAGWAYSHDAGQTWTFPGVLEQEVFRSDPVLDADADGNIYYYSLTYDLSCDLFKSTDGGVSWGPGVSAFGGDKAWMAIDRTDSIGRGNIYLAWTGGDQFTRSTDGGSMFLDPLSNPVNYTFWGTLSVAPDGTLYLVDRRFNIVRSTDAEDPGVIPTFSLVGVADLGGYISGWGGPNPGGLLGQAWVATDHSDGPTRGNVYVLASVNPPGSDPLDVMFARSTDSGVTWSEPVRVNDDPPDNGAWQWFGTMSVAPNGRIDVVWNDTRNSGATNLSELYYAYSTDSGSSWSENVPVSPMFDSWIGWPNQSKIGDYYDMVSDNGGANLAYAATFNNEQDVYFLRISDCNQNGIIDDVDIAGGTSEDCNENLMPDECEPDCNDNGIPDDCDIAGGTSQDANENGIPDECRLVFYVDADADGLNTGANWGDAYDSLTDGLAAARCSSVLFEKEIWVAAGTYTPAGPGGGREATFRLSNYVAVYGGFAGGETTLDQRDPTIHATILSGDLNGDDDWEPPMNDNAYNVVTASGTNQSAVLDGFIISGGNACSSPATFGGGMFTENGSPTLIRCTFKSNLGGRGGALFISGGSPKLINCNFIGNVGADGGGIHAHKGSATLTNCAFSGNSAHGGGAILSYHSTLTLINCTCSGNTASDSTGGILNATASDLLLTNCILWGNSDAGGTDESAQIHASGTVVVDYTCIEGLTGDLGGVGNIGDDPLFLDADGPDGVPGTADDDLRLRWDSPCINTGDPDFDASGIPTDLDGHARVLCGWVDMGAYEFGIGNVDCDEFVDLFDFAGAVPCLTGPDDGPLDPGCEAFDFDGDEDVDLLDLRGFQNLFAGND